MDKGTHSAAYRAKYEGYRRWFLRHEGALKLLRLLTKSLPLLSYVGYPILLVMLCFTRREMLLRSIIVPGLGFVLCTVIRNAINAPRPYESGITPLVGKDTKGQSFPSRHMACAAVIAVTWLRFSVPVGVILLAVTVLIAFCRVLAGVHYPRDVVAGGLLGGLIGWIGMFLIP